MISGQEHMNMSYLFRVQKSQRHDSIYAKKLKPVVLWTLY